MKPARAGPRRGPASQARPPLSHLSATSTSRRSLRTCHGARAGRPGPRAASFPAREADALPASRFRPAPPGAARPSPAWRCDPTRPPPAPERESGSSQLPELERKPEGPTCRGRCGRRPPSLHASTRGRPRQKSG
ncbi:sterile alpha motif domain-containing protein 1-like [Manis pentadactyla]|uniref:sterile alpha motif domain-containing protein 1-like n=1 Tax=Manis pentadactyla TaxID=143292 RepID=UPI00255C394F|nr:sterile alpha motif domain-containing protein 1-like [Manis pentadactyla]